MGLMLSLAPRTEAVKPAVTKALTAAGLLYGHLDTETHFLCSTFTFAHNGNKYEIGTASHCVSDPDLPKGVTFTIVFNEATKKEYPVKVVAAGGINSEKGDVAILEIETTDKLAVTPLSEQEVSYGDRVYYAGGANALGKQIYFGVVSAPQVNITKTDGNEDAPAGWNNVMLIGLAGGPGASGSGILNRKGQIVGILVGHPMQGVGVTIAVRTEQLKKLLAKSNK